MAVAFPVAPVKEGGQHPHIATDSVCGEILFPHLHDHGVDMAALQL